MMMLGIFFFPHCVLLSLLSTMASASNGTSWEELRWSSSRGPSFAERSVVALERYRSSESSGCGEVRRVHKETVALGCAACAGRSSSRDQWCPRRDCEGKNARWFGHPQGTTYAGKRGKFLYVTVPKAATTALRSWARAAFHDDEAPPASWLAGDDEKPPADRVEGFVLWDDVPEETRAKAVAFAVVRDPLDRFASGWRELTAYERGPPERRAWGRAVLRRQRFFRARGDDGPRLFGSTTNGPFGGEASKNASSLVLAEAVRDLACDVDWNEHLSPQTAFFPADFLRRRPAVASHDALGSFLPLAATRAGLSPVTARKFSNNDGLPQQQQRTKKQRNARDGWPQPTDVLAAMDLADDHGNPDVPTRFLWCWIYAADYAAFPNLFQPPPWCDAAFQQQQ
mmetsp:Transcript_765/g.2604  ORF Transcript_765/g.2604 Transcript_765/m.2604 type:complete len:398 (-) Transcript_765:40-1233(-)